MLLPLTACKDCYSIKAAAKFMGLKNTKYAKEFLGEPDMIEKGKTSPRFLYFPETVEQAKAKLEEKRAKAKENKGKRSCYCCHEKHDKKDLTCGMCLKCKALNIVANFTCCNDCLCHAPEYRRFCIIREAITKYGAELKAKAMAKKK